MIFTVFTPTFNRAHTLHRVYNSLCAQTFSDFEWVVVDDGSEDNTESLIAQWTKEADFPVLCKKQKNRGKHVAINHGVALAKGELFIIADSDDEFLPDALSIFYDEWMAIEPNQKEKFTGVTGLCITTDNEIIGNKFPQDIFDSTPAEAYYLHGIRGDKAGFHRTEVLRQYPFPEIPNHKFIAESIIWNRIGKQFLTRYINLPVRKVYTDGEDHLTEINPTLRSQNRIFYSIIVNEDINFFFKAPITMLKLATQGARFSFHQQDRIIEQLSRLDNLPAKILWISALPLAYFIYLFDKVAAR